MNRVATRWSLGLTGFVELPCIASLGHSTTSWTGTSGEQRRVPGRSKGRRPLTCLKQALLILAWLRTKGRRRGGVPARCWFGGAGWASGAGCTGFRCGGRQAQFGVRGDE